MNTSSLPRQFALDLSHTPKSSLENYLPGKDFALLSTLQEICKSWSLASNHSVTNPLNERWIYWWGAEGSGRTHLLEAMTNAAEYAGLENFSLNPNEPISWVRIEEQMNTLAERDAPSVITVDDVDRLDERLVGALFRVLNIVQASKNIHVFMAGKAAPATLELREDLRTRLGWGLVFQTQLLNDDEKYKP